MMSIGNKSGFQIPKQTMAQTHQCTSFETNDKNSDYYECDKFIPVP